CAGRCGLWVTGAVGVAGAGLALYLIENFRAPAPTGFAFGGFILAGSGLAFLQLAIENLGRPIVPARLDAPLFAAAFGILLLYIWHARQREDPILDLRLLRIRTFRVGTVTGSLCRMGLDATPFLLPLLFQVGFGLSPLHSGLLTFSASLRAMLVRIFCRWFLRVFVVRRLLAGNACFAAAVTAACGLLQADTPTWLVVALLLLSGCVRSIQYLGLNAVSYADVPPPLLSKSTSVGGVAQQLARGFGVAVGAALLAIIAGSAQVTIGHFALALCVIALVPLVSALGFLRLSPGDGAEVSGPRRARPRTA